MGALLRRCLLPLGEVSLQHLSAQGRCQPSLGRSRPPLQTLRVQGGVARANTLRNTYPDILISWFRISGFTHQVSEFRMHTWLWWAFKHLWSSVDITVQSSVSCSTVSTPPLPLCNLPNLTHTFSCNCLLPARSLSLCSGSLHCNSLGTEAQRAVSRLSASMERCWLG